MLLKNLLQNCLILVLIFSTLTLQATRKTKKTFLDVPIFKEFFCNFSAEMQEMMFSNSSCKLTKVDRKINAINIYILLKEPVDMIWMKCILYFKKEGNFREVLTGPEIDFCTFGKEKQNGFLLQQIQDLIQRVFPGFKCPRSELNISNITIPAHPIMSVLPTGFYKLMTFIRYTENGPSSYNVTTLFQFETYKDRL
ncbi:hypothetical protein ACKWTF_013261 [Chironomus riparius]